MKKKTIFRLLALVIVGLVVWELLFDGMTFQTAPYSLSNAAALTAYRVTGNESDKRFFANDPNTIEGYAIVQQQVVSDPHLKQDVIDLLDSRLIYGMQGAMCFQPGIGFRFGEGSNAIDVLVCLDCQHVYFYSNGSVATRNLNSLGISRFKTLYPRLFPGHSVDGSDEDYQKATAARDQEREKREEGAATQRSGS